jgi:hypothetical protein
LLVALLVGSFSLADDASPASSAPVVPAVPGAANRMRDVVTTNGSTPVEEFHYTYDAAGNRTLRQHKFGAGSMVNTSYGYNTANELCYSVSGTPTGTCTTPPTGRWPSPTTTTASA